jgi:steroid 5-alpha reductase family enzyme
MSDWLIALLISIGFNLALFFPAYIYKTDKLTDLSYALSFIILVTFGFLGSIQYPLDTLLFIMVLVWAARLGGFLFIRIQKIKRDKRFDDRRDNFVGFLSFWLLQGMTVAIVMTSALLVFNTDVDKLVGYWAIAGVIVYLLGLTLESVADTQKYQFNQTNKSGAWIDQGVWRISRHPNYLGEMLVWIGVYLVAFEPLTTGARFIGLVSPLFIIILLLFVSGIPLLEKSADKKWGKNEKYQAYKKSVPVLIPNLNSIKRLQSKILD